MLDCKIRDGGLIKNHYFTDEFVRAVYWALSKSGVDYMEFGYRSRERCIRQKITGILNEHPHTAIAYRKTEDKDKYAEFYEQIRMPQV